MADQLDLNDNLAAVFRRAVDEELDAALAELQNADADLHDAIHDARKRFKKIRAMLRLVRPAIGKARFRRENVRYRDAGRQLAAIRDSRARQETLELLVPHLPGDFPPAALATLRAHFATAHQVALLAPDDRQVLLANITAVLADGREALLAWPDFADDFTVIRRGVESVYARGRNWLRDCCQSTTASNLHEWRKQVKYLWHQVRLLIPIWPELLTTVADTLRRLSKVLGEDHDLAELRLYLDGNECPPLDETAMAYLRAAIDARHVTLTAEAFMLGEMIFAERKAEFGARLHAYWRAARQRPVPPVIPNDQPTAS